MSAGPDAFDLVIVGGGINGVGIARDAAGRGLRTLLVEQGDLGAATSSASSKLIHGGLRYLEHYEFRLVAEALAEREVLLRIAPHVVWPLDFVLPHMPHLRPRWMIRAGLFLYDTIGGRSSLPRSSGVKLGPPDTAPDCPAHARLHPTAASTMRARRPNASSAAEQGASILPRTRCVRDDATAICGA
jgi:glycerol-3-phosphate dehydrogenase